jgi:outer membrane protein OmpA-like peptidoglycan-associated protein
VLKPTVLPPDKPVEMSLGTIADAPAVEPVRPQPTEPVTPQSFFETIYFGLDSFDLRLSTKTALEEIGKRLEATQGMIHIIGGCSPEGSAPYNMGLGLERAKAARDYLIALGIDAARFDISSVGEEQLVSTNESEYWCDRRCEITLK